MKKKSSYRSYSLTDTIISVITVSQNDADILLERIQEIERQLKKIHSNYEIIVVDNNSEDESVEIIRKNHSKFPHVRTIILSRNYSREIALTAGIDACIGDYAILFGLYTDPVEIIPKLIDEQLKKIDIVQGKPTKQLVELGLLSTLFTKFISRFSTHGLTYSQIDTMCLNKKAINAITRIRRKNRSFSYLHSLIGLRKSHVEYKPLLKYRNKIKTESFIEIVFKITDIVVSNSFRPIRFLNLLGMFFSTLFLMYVGAIIVLALFLNIHLAPQGWISVSTVIGVMFFLIFSLLTLISEYIIRILNESRNEPFYFVAEELDKSTVLRKKSLLNVIKV